MSFVDWLFLARALSEKNAFSYNVAITYLNKSCFEGLEGKMASGCDKEGCLAQYWTEL